MPDFPTSLIPTWIADTTPNPSATNVATNTAIRIKFAKAIDVSGHLSNSNFVLHCPSGVVVNDPFDDINSVFDYNGLSRVLYLKPTVALSGSCVYTLSISGLYDAAGTPMPSAHIFSFETASGEDGTINETYDQIDVDELVIEDYAPQVPTSPLVSDFVTISVISTPYNGQIGVAPGYGNGIVTITYSQTGVDTDLIAVAYIDWSSPTSVLTPATITVTTSVVSDSLVVEVQMPEMNTGSGDYFPENHAFYIDAVYETIIFTGVLNPLFISPAILTAFLNNDINFIEAARYAYWVSQEIDLMLGINGVTGTISNTPEIQQFALYLALDRIYTQTNSTDDFQLGQLRIMEGKSSSFGMGGGSPYSVPLQYWWKKLMGGNKCALATTIDRQNQFFNRNWSIKGTIGYPSIPYLISQRTPRYGRLL